MIGGFGRTSGLALLAAAGLFAGSMSAQAADLGGDCCADLEERVAELEATTARKGNRKVKLTVSGWVNEGVESNTYQATNLIAQTRFRFVGDAKINADWSAGYLIEIGVAGANSSNIDHNVDDSGAALNVRHSAWWIQNKNLGKVWVGQTSASTDGITEINLANTAHFATQNASAQNGRFQERTSSLQLRQFMGGAASATGSNTSGQIGEGERLNVVKYETPTIAGFIASAAWGEDDMWDIALRYAGEFAGFKIAAGVGYMSWKDSNGGTSEFNCAVGVLPDNDCQQLGASGAIMHVATGLYVHAAYGIRWDDNVGPGLDDSSTQLYVQAGIEQKFFPLGKTTLFGEYQKWEIGAVGAAAAQNSDMTMWGVGLNQAIEAAAMDLYLRYNHFSPDATGFVGEENFKVLMAGGIIRF